MKAFKAFVKPFEAPQGSVKIKISFIFFVLPGIGTLRVKRVTATFFMAMFIIFCLEATLQW